MKDAMDWHKAEAGEKLCSVCGCASAGRARHRAITADEGFRYGGANGKAVLWEKYISLCFGTDFTARPLT